VEIFPYFFGPVGLLLLINLILFAATAHELTCGLWKREVVKSNTERYVKIHSAQIPAMLA
jgi:G protein-coupled receptor Mth (Methuselah protein)